MRNKQKRLITFIMLLVVSVLFNPAILSHAQPTGYGVIGENQKVELLDGIAELFVKVGAEFFDAAAYYRLNDIDDEVILNNFAVVLPVSDDKNWHLYIQREYSGYLDKVYSPDKKRMLSYYETDGIEAEFYHEPAYDFDKHKLSWCIRLTYPDSGPSYLLYQELIFIRDGCLSVEFYCIPNAESAELILYAGDAITINDGYTYNDFDAAEDEVCGYDFIGNFLYGAYSPDEPEDQGAADSSFEISFGGSPGRAAGNFAVALIVIASLLLRTRKSMRKQTPKKISGKNPQADRKREKRHKSINEKRQFKLRRTYDTEDALDSRSYYQKLREEEERMARRYDR